MRTSINGMAERFKADLDSPGLLVLPGCYDVFSAHIVARAGFRHVFLSGYGVAASSLGNPDIGLTTLSETVQVTKNVVSVLDVPLIVDVDNGYGNQDNVIRTVYELEQAGAAGMIIEDQVMPKRCGHTDDKKIVPLPTYMAKLECALKSRKTVMPIIARTDAPDLDEGIARAQTFHAAGADVVMIDGLRSADDLKRVGDEVPGNKLVNIIYGGKTPVLPNSEYSALGFKLVLYSTPALYIVARSLERWMKALYEAEDLNAISEVSMRFDDFQTLITEAYRQRFSRDLVG